MCAQRVSTVLFDHDHVRIHNYALTAHVHVHTHKRAHVRSKPLRAGKGKAKKAKPKVVHPYGMCPYLPIYLSIYVSVYLSIYLSIYLIAIYVFLVKMYRQGLDELLKSYVWALFKIAPIKAMCLVPAEVVTDQVTEYFNENKS
jgi:hypothetical protein